MSDIIVSIIVAYQIIPAVGNSYIIWIDQMFFIGCSVKLSVCSVLIVKKRYLTVSLDCFAYTFKIPEKLIVLCAFHIIQTVYMFHSVLKINARLSYKLVYK